MGKEVKVKRVLVGSAIYQKENILEQFLDSLGRLVSDDFLIDFVFVDDNPDEKSKDLLKHFARDNSKVDIFQGQVKTEYVCDENTHGWNGALILKVANYKNSIIKHCIEQDYDYLFFIDSDLIIYPNLIEHLMSLQKDVVSEIFWTSWEKEKALEPNVWLFDEYNMVAREIGEQLTDKEKFVRREKFLNMLKEAGVYEVGGLGACTLITKKALLQKLNFEPISNLSIWGEDRFFCIRAAVLGIKLYVDTHYPAYHIYRQSDLEGVEEYKSNSLKNVNFGRRVKKKGNKITLSMIVKNEGDKYLKKVLESVKNHIDEAVIIDDASTDNTVDICRQTLSNIPLIIIKNQETMFSKEHLLRKIQWEETVKTDPDWILNLDADEIIQEGFWQKSKAIINEENIDAIGFRLYDMWSENEYREDKYWEAHKFYKTFMLRYQPEFHYQWNDQNQHCGRFPMNIFAFKQKNVEDGVMHWGWSKEKDRITKYNRYKELDPEGIYGVIKQYNSILDDKVNLVQWKDKV